MSIATANAFLDYVAANTPRLKRALAKNTTYNREIFDDAFNDTILKVYKSLSKNDTEIKDFETYTFTALKWTYVLADNRHKRHLKRMDTEYFEDERHQPTQEDTDTDVREQRFERELLALQTIKQTIAEQYGTESAELYFTYMTNKTNGNGCSYQKLAEKSGLTLTRVSNIIKEIKQYVKTSPKIKDIKSQTYADD